MSYTKRAIFGASFIMLFHVFSDLLSYLTRIVLARNLTPTELGLFYSVFTFVIFFLFFRDLGQGSALLKFIPELRLSKKYNEIKTSIFSVISMQVVSSMIFILIIWLIADKLAVSYFRDSSAVGLLQLMSIYVFFSIFYILFRKVFHGFQSVFVFASMEFVKAFTILVLVLIGLSFSTTPLAPMIAYALVSPIIVLLYFPLLLKRFNLFKYKIKNVVPVSKKIFWFGLPMFATSVGSKIIGYVDTLILTYFRPLAEVGVYNVVLPSALVMLFLGNTLASISLPISSELFAKKDLVRLSAGMKLIYKYLFLLIIPLVFSLFIFSEFFINLFFGKEYLSGVIALQILLVGVLFYSIAVINHNLISGIGKPFEVTKIIMGSAILNIVLNFILIPLYGLNGAAIATTLSYLLALILSTGKVVKFIKIKWPIVEWSKGLFGAFSFIFTALYLRQILFVNIWVEILVTLSVSFIVYILVLFLTKAIDIKEVTKYARLVK